MLLHFQLGSRMHLEPDIYCIIYMLKNLGSTEHA